MLAVFDLSRWPWLTALLLFSAFVFFWRAARRLEHVRSATGLLLVAAALRLLLLPLPPTLSDDTLRYVWDGRVLTAGFNPYLHPPEAENLLPLRDDLWQRMPHQDVPTVYPPLALAVFSVASWLPGSLVTVKILLAIVEFFGCLLLLRLAERLKLPVGRAIWYLWNPLPVLEVAGMGHVDALVVTASTAAVLLLVGNKSGRASWAAVAAAAGVLFKLLPAIAVPMWARQSGRTITFLAVAGAVVAAGLLPVFVSTGGVPPGLLKYGISWEFNGPLYEPLWRLWDALHLDRGVKGVLDFLKQSTGYHDFWNRFYPSVYPQLLAKLTLLPLLGLFFLRSLREEHPVLGSGRLFGGLLLCTATFYPWYILLVLPWAALARHRAWLALSALLQISYLPGLFGVSFWPGFYLAIWVPFFLLLMRSRWSID